MFEMKIVIIAGWCLIELLIMIIDDEWMRSYEWWSFMVIDDWWLMVIDGWMDEWMMEAAWCSLMMHDEDETMDLDVSVLPSKMYHLQEV